MATTGDRRNPSPSTANGVRRAVSRRLGLTATLFPYATPEAVIDGYSAIMGELHPDGFRTMARSLAEADLRDVLPKIRVPTLLVYGDRDARASLDVAEDIRNAIPESRLVVLPGVGHMSSVQAGDQLNREFRRFLRAAPP